MSIHVTRKSENEITEIRNKQREREKKESNRIRIEQARLSKLRLREALSDDSDSIWGIIPVTPKPGSLEYRIFWDSTYQKNLFHPEYTVSEDVQLLWEIMCRQEVSERKKRELWDLAYKYVLRHERKQFKMAYQVDEDRTLDRILGFYEFVQTQWFRTPKWLLFVWHAASSEIEAVFQLRRYGIALQHDGCIMNYRTRFIKFFVILQRIAKEGVTYEEYHIRRYHKYPTTGALYQFQFYKNQVEMVLSRTPQAIEILNWKEHDLSILEEIECVNIWNMEDL